MTKVGVVGLGRMGGPMSTNLASSGFEVLLWNRSIDKANTLAEASGANVCQTPRELAESSDVVITMLSDDAASNAVHHGAEGLFASSAGATYILEMGTHSPSHILELAKNSPHATVIDAPVSGSVAAAAGAQLLIMAGGTEADIDPVRGVLDAVGRQTICLGSVGSGSRMKLVVNMLIHGLNQTVAEALVLAEASGIDIADAYRTLENSAAAAPMLGYRKENYLDEASTPVSFALSLARKDVELALGMAKDAGLTLSQTEMTLSELRGAEADGLGERDMAAIITYLRGKS
ncbi:MAG: 3-hydroxyisobutyrate dehydrogenase-like beta-hydroxyacid dehydrogenase [Verrucomicrobiales bacterium]|jgi:3-hydroxyisobutyrate dehydrogenase-like beta-hydroxyacid dehydrogenase